MAVLHFQASYSQPQPNGPPQVLSALEAMILRGPVVQVSVSIASSFSSQLLTQGKAIPQPITGLALIDTGAGITCIDEVSANIAGLPVIDVINIASASHATTQKPVFPIQVEILGSNIKTEIPRACGGELLAAQGILMLIGRDFLADCTLIYNGATGTATLAK